MEYPCARCKGVRDNYYHHYTHYCDKCEKIKEYRKQEEEKGDADG